MVRKSGSHLVAAATAGPGDFRSAFSLPESPRWLATHGQGQRALDLLQRMGLRTVPLASLRTGAASDTKSDPLGIVLRENTRAA